jgi:hypothetical protein
MFVISDQTGSIRDSPDESRLQGLGIGRGTWPDARAIDDRNLEIHDPEAKRAA